MPQAYFPESPYPFRGVSGVIEVAVIAFEDGDPSFQGVDPEDGQTKNKGQSLAYMRQVFKGDEGDLRDPLAGTMHHISLAQWVDKDPDKTFIHIRFRFVPQ